MNTKSPHHEASVLTGLSLLIPITLSTMAIVLLAPILPKMMAEYSYLPNFEYWVPMVLTVPALCVALLSPIAGMLGDYFGRRKLLIWSFLLYVVVGIAPLYLTDFWLILGSRVGVGVAEALIMVLSTTMIGDYFKGAARERWLAMQTTTASISALFFFVIGGYLGEFSWRTPFWVYLSAIVMMTMVIRFTWEPSEKDALDEADVAPHHLSWAGFPWKVFLPVMLVTVYAGVFFYTVQIFASLGLSQIGMTSPQTIGWVTSAASLGVPIGTLIFAHLLVGRPPVILLLLELLVLSVGFGLMGFATSPLPFLIGCFINQVGAGMLLPTLLIWAMSQLAFEVRSRGAGLWQSSLAAAQFLCPLVVTALSQRFGGNFQAFSALAVAALVGAFIALLAGRKSGMARAAVA